MTKVFVFKECLGEQFHNVLDYINIYGTEYENERGQKYLEAEPITIVVENPKWEDPSEVLPMYITQRFSNEWIVQYAYRVAYGLPEPGDWAYSYGERLAENNQIPNIVQKLKNNSDTRQATCSTYWPTDTEMETPPCLSVVDFKIRNGELRVFGWFRSNDMENGYCNNYYDMLLLAYRVASEIGVPVGRITTRSESAHIYKWREQA